MKKILIEIGKWLLAIILLCLAATLLAWAGLYILGAVWILFCLAYGVGFLWVIKRGIEEWFRSVRDKT